MGRNHWCESSIGGDIMSQHELNPQKVLGELNDWKTQFDMIQGRANGILSNGATQMLQRCADKINTLLGENQKLKKQLDEALKLVPKANCSPIIRFRSYLVVQFHHGLSCHANCKYSYYDCYEADN